MRRPSSAAVAALPVVLALLTNLATGTVAVDGPLPTTVVWVVTAAIATAAVVVEMRHRAAQPPAPNSDDLEAVLGPLAQSVGKQRQLAERQRRINVPLPLPVRWVTARDALMDHWANIRLAPAGKQSGPLPLVGKLDEIAVVYRKVPSGRLVILGEAGSGKSVLAGRLALRLLEEREPGGPVPVVVDMASWTPPATLLHEPDRTIPYAKGQSLSHWLTAQLTRNHPALAVPSGTGLTTAQMLVDGRHVLPILDGLDELPVGLRAAALRALDDADMPVVVTSRPDEYEKAAATPLSRAAAVMVLPLAADDLLAYLPRTRHATTAAHDDWRTALSYRRTPFSGKPCGIR